VSLLEPIEIPCIDLTLIGKSDVEKERSTKQQRRKWYEYRNVAECRSMGSGDLRGGRIGRIPFAST